MSSGTELNFQASYDSILSLIESEKKCEIHFSRKYTTAIGYWEYLYYFLSLFIARSHVHTSYAPLASLYSEAHSSLRAAFLLNNKGYHVEALSLLRRVHECFSKMIGVRMSPKNAWKIISNTSIQGIEAKFGVNLKWIYELESSYLHGNKLEAFSIAKKLQNQETKFGIEYGPQLNDIEYQVMNNLSIFWIGLIILVSPKIFEKQVPDFWLKKYDQSIKYAKSYLRGLPKSKLLSEFTAIETLLDKIV